MAGPDELDYLHRGFDLTTLTFAVLRGILVMHGVECQQAHRKQDFLKLVRQKIVPKRDRIIKYSQQAQATVFITYKQIWHRLMMIPGLWPPQN